MKNAVPSLSVVHDPLARTFTTSLGLPSDVTRGPNAFGLTYGAGSVGAITVANTLGRSAFRKSVCTLASIEGTGGITLSKADRMLDR
jgi:hypothetical protein